MTTSTLSGAVLHQLRNWIQPGEREPLDFPFSRTDIAALQRHAPGAGAQVDDQTWDDMLAPDLLAQMGRSASIFGQQWLFRSLRSGSGGAGVAQRVRGWLADPARRSAATAALRPLRDARAELASLLYGEVPSPAPARTRMLLRLAILVLPVSLLAGFVMHAIFWGVVLGMVVLMIGQVRFYNRVAEWRSINEALQLLLVARFQFDGDVRARALAQRLAPAVLDRLPGAREYREWLLLSNVRHYFDNLDAVQEELDYLRESFSLCAAADAELALARHIETFAACWSEASDGAMLALEEMTHPLLAETAPLSLRLDGKGAFVTGQNGVGKSTLLRMVGLNVLMARAFGFCHARAASIPDLPLYTSMQSEDSLLGGESHYNAELRRARELLDAPRGIYLFDEIFRGTNHLESVSAAAAVLGALAARGLVLATSHNVVLAAILEPGLTPLRLRRMPQGLLLEAGKLEQTNGLTLLAAHGFGPEIEAEAARVYAWMIRPGQVPDAPHHGESTACTGST